MSQFNQIPEFKDGLAQPIFPFTDGKLGEKYDAEVSAIVRYCVYVESDYDMDGTGKRDLIKALVQVPRSAVEGNYKAATVIEARPYGAGTWADGYDHMKEVQAKTYTNFDFTVKQPAPRKVEGCMSAWEAALKTSPSDWYYEDKGDPGSFVYENLDWYNYYLVRGFAVVLSAGRGTLGSDGFVECGGEYEKEAFKCVVEWLHGDRVAFVDREGKIETKADWSNGNVAMTGRSYAGTMPFAVATTGVEGLKTIVPVAGISDWYSFLNQQGAQRYWPQEMLSSFLDYFCSSNYNDDTLTEEQKLKIEAFQNRRSLAQIKSGFDYSDYWTTGNYTLNAKNIKCSALIVHGYNDENVSTKQFEMMHQSFLDANANVKLLLHQGAHMTPTLPAKKHGISVDGNLYDDVLNRWFSHYLYGEENGAENMPAVLTQSNVDQSKWETCDSWKVNNELELSCNHGGETILDTDWEKADVNAENFDERMSLSDTNMNQRYVTDALTEDVTLQGSVRVDFKACLKSGNPADCFGAENKNNADELSLDLGRESGKMDDVKMTVMLCDIADEDFDSIAAIDPERNVIPVEVVKEGGVVNGGELPAFDLVKFKTQHRKFKVISRCYIDLCNPESGYAPETSAKSITLKAGEVHEYHAYLNPMRHTIVAGHKLAVVLDTEDPINCLLHKTYSVGIDDASVKAVLPVATKSGKMELTK